jgi:hypothetical protein
MGFIPEFEGFIDKFERYNQNYVHSTVLLYTKHTKSHTNSDFSKNYCELWNELAYVEAFRSFRHKNSCLNAVMFLRNTNFVYYSTITQWYFTFKDC